MELPLLRPPPYHPQQVLLALCLALPVPPRLPPLLLHLLSIFFLIFFLFSNFSFFFFLIFFNFLIFFFFKYFLFGWGITPHHHIGNANQSFFVLEVAHFQCFYSVFSLIGVTCGQIVNYDIAIKDQLSQKTDFGRLDNKING